MTLSIEAGVVSLVGGRRLAAVVGALLAQSVPVRVMLRDGDAGADLAGYPEVVAMRAEGRPVPQQRAALANASTADVVALLEDTGRPSHGWAEALRAALGDDSVTAVSGTTEVDRTLSAREAALAWLEYGSFRTARTTTGLAGNNMAFRRAAWCRIAQAAGGGLIEQDLAERLVLAGGRIVVAPAMRVRYEGGDGRSDRVASRFHHGRLYGGAWAEGRGWGGRAAHVLAGPAIALVLSARAWRHAAATWGPLAALRLLPWSMALAGGWTVGEMVGVALGAGQALSRWR